jgi:hypothetical protein
VTKLEIRECKLSSDDCELPTGRERASFAGLRGYLESQLGSHLRSGAYVGVGSLGRRAVSFEMSDSLPGGGSVLGLPASSTVFRRCSMSDRHSGCVNT